MIRRRYASRNFIWHHTKKIWNARLRVCKSLQLRVENWITGEVACLFCQHYMCISAFRSIMTPFSHIFDCQGWHIKLALRFTAHKSNLMTTCTLVPSNLLPKGILLVCVWKTSLARLTHRARPSIHSWLTHQARSSIHSSCNFLRLSMFWYTYLSFRGTEKDAQYFPAHNLM
jgi:hypothetical protein